MNHCWIIGLFDTYTIIYDTNQMDCHRRSRSRSVDHNRIRSKSDRRKRYKNEHKYKKSRRLHESEDSSSSSRRDRRYRSKKRKRSKDPKRKHHKRKKDKHKRKRNRDRSCSPRRSKSPSVSNTLAAPQGAHELASALTKLFTLYPSMASIDEGGIPLLLIQLGRGTEYNLSHMPDRNLAGLLGDVFMSMRVHGMEISNGAWKWGNAPPANNGISNGDDLALLRLTRALLNGVNLNLESVKEYEMIQQQQQKLAMQQQSCQQSEISPASSNGNSVETKQVLNIEDVSQRKRIERMTSQLLDRFGRSAGSSEANSSSLASELEGICEAILEGESVQLDGIENVKLRASLSQLLQLVGLVLVEIEGEDEVDEGKSAGSSIDMGYALPDNCSDVTIVSNLKDVLRVCRFRSSYGKECAPILWAGTPQNEPESQSSDEDVVGPSPLGTVGAIAAKRNVQQIKPHTTSAGLDKGDREEWMMVPGEHNFLKGISKSDFRGRKFKNSKSSSDAASAAQPINPGVLAEVHAIQQAYQESRGQSLLDAHRQTKVQQQQQDKKKEEWKWSREKNLDDGRRVDKNALQMVLGDASTQLRSKFQSGHQ